MAYYTDHVAAMRVHLINNQYPLEDAHAAKVTKYQALRDPLGALRHRGVLFISKTMSWRGVFSAAFYHEHSVFHLLRTNDFKLLALCELNWTYCISRSFQNMTFQKRKKWRGDYKVPDIFVWLAQPALRDEM